MSWMGLSAHTHTHTHTQKAEIHTQRERVWASYLIRSSEVKRPFNHLYRAVPLRLRSSLANCLTSFPSSDLF